MSPSRSAALRFPVKLNDCYTCQGIDAEGVQVYFEDLLDEGQQVGSYSDGFGNVYGPMATVVRKDDGLWVEMPPDPALKGEE